MLFSMSPLFRRPATSRRWGAPVVALVVAALAVPGSARAQESGWTVRLQPLYVSPYGHDQHVLTIHEVDMAAESDVKRAVSLETASGPAYRAEVVYARGAWRWGVDFFWFVTSQRDPRRLTAAGGGTADEVVFEVADRTFTSTGPAESLYYMVLEDTDMAMWTLDVFGKRMLMEDPRVRLALQLGMRFGDFDNDYRAAAGIEGTEGVRLDASSNYGRMTGPLIGLSGAVRLGPTSLHGSVRQSVIMGEAWLPTRAREFTAPFGGPGPPAYVSDESFSKDEEVAIPVTDLHLRGTWELMDHLAVGAGTQVSTWWDVSVPPGVIPVVGGDQTFHENTVVLFGLSAVVEIRF